MNADFRHSFPKYVSGDGVNCLKIVDYAQKRVLVAKAEVSIILWLIRSISRLIDFPEASLAGRSQVLILSPLRYPCAEDKCKQKLNSTLELA
jgi:hypothetical protein